MALDPVVIDFATRGVAEVGRAFELIQRRVERMEKAAAAASGKSAKTREQAVASVTKTVERSERMMTRAVETETRRRETIEKRHGQNITTLARESIRGTETTEAQKTRVIEREADRRMRIQIRSSEMAGRFAARQAAQEISARERAEARWGQRGRRLGGKIAGSVGGLASGAASMAGATLGIGGGMLLADAARREMSAERTAALLVNAVTTGNAPPPGATVGNILGKAGQLSKELGVDKDTIATGALEYARKAKGGDFAGVMGNMGFFAELSKVTGADITDIAQAAGTLQSQNQNLDTKGMQQMMLNIYAQGKAGSMSMVDVAKQVGTLASTRSAFQGDAATNQRKLMALGQLAAPEGSVEEAGTYIKDLSMALSKPKDLDRLKKWGVKLDKFGAVESPENLIDSVFRGSGGDITKIAAVFGARGVPLFRGLESAYKGAGGGEAGISAVNAEMAKVTGATMTVDQLHAQNAQIDSTPAAKFHNALNRITETVEEKLEPGMERFADRLPEMLPKFEAIIDEAGKLAGYFEENPFKGIGLIAGAAIAKELASATVGAAAEAGVGAIMKQIAALLGGGGLSDIAGSATTAGSTVASTATTGAAAAAATRVVAGIQGAGAVSMLANIATGGDRDLIARTKADKATTGEIVKDTFDMKSWGDALQKTIAAAVSDPIKFLTSDPMRRGGNGAAGPTDPIRNVSIANRPVQ